MVGVWSWWRYFLFPCRIVFPNRYKRKFTWTKTNPNSVVWKRKRWNTWINMIFCSGLFNKLILHASNQLKCTASEWVLICFRKWNFPCIISTYIIHTLEWFHFTYAVVWYGTFERVTFECIKQQWIFKCVPLLSDLNMKEEKFKLISFFYF